MRVTILGDKNQELPTGRIGEVCIRGPNVTKGYINRPEANEEAFAGLLNISSACKTTVDIFTPITVSDLQGKHR